LPWLGAAIAVTALALSVLSDTLHRGSRRVALEFSDGR
jgi:hypothetical protein